MSSLGTLLAAGGGLIDDECTGTAIDIKQNAIVAQSISFLIRVCLEINLSSSRLFAKKMNSISIFVDLHADKTFFSEII
jgi:hypothetical protein